MDRTHAVSSVALTKAPAAEEDVPLVSVVVPAYCHERYILDCLKSIHAQIHPRIELIFIHDASTDNTFERASEIVSPPFGDRFENVILERKDENAGAHDSLNRGIALSNGSHVAILNSDDLFHPARLERMLAALEAAGSAFAFSAVEPLADEAVAGRADAFPEGLLLFGLRQRLAVANAPSMGFALLRSNIAVGTGNFLFTRELAKQVGPFLDLKYCHDWDFILQATLFTEPVFVDEPLYSYRLHPQNAFRGYTLLAERETEIVRERFLSAVAGADLPNRKCPSPRNYPGYFDLVMQDLKTLDLWRRVAGARTARARTVDATPHYRRRPQNGSAAALEAAATPLADSVEEVRLG